MKRVSWILVVVLLFAGMPCLAGEDDFSAVRQRILSRLDSIQSYELEVVFSEAVDPSRKSDNYAFYSLMLGLVKTMEPKDGDLDLSKIFNKENLSDFKSVAKSNIKYKKPDRLCIDAAATVKGMGAASQTIRIYTTFDGRFQKCRTTRSAGGRSAENSVKMDTAINTEEKPFDGWNLKGFGLGEGTEYIGTVKSFIEIHDLRADGKKDGLLLFSGKINEKKFRQMLSKTLPPEFVDLMVKMVCGSEKSFSLVVDPKTDLVVGYIGEYDAVMHPVKRIASFENIQINPNIPDDAFTFQARPGEKFTDITRMVSEGREQSKKLLDKMPRK